MVVVLVVFSGRMDTSDARDNDPGRNNLKKSAAVSIKEKRQSKVMRTGALSDTRRLEYIPVPCRQGSENK